MPSSKTSLATLLSLIIPGSGQVYLKRRSRGALIFLAAVLLVFLVVWSQNTIKVGILNLAGLAVTWLWLPLFLFWVWNVFDARAIAKDKPTTPLPWSCWPR